MPLGFDEACVIALIGLIAGALGGLAGVGGSVFILPALHIAFGTIFPEPKDPQIHHMYMAAAMAVNVAVSLPAAIHHHRAGAVRTSLLPTLLPANAAAVLLGVVLSNRFEGDSLRFVLAVFLMCYCVWNLGMIARPRRRKFDGQGRIENATRPRLVFCGGVTGVVGGLLGLGGGFLLVPLLQIGCNVKLKNAIATSSAVLCVTAAIGAILKIATLPQHGESASQAGVYALLMAPTGVIGALAGARWLHRLQVTWVRVIITLLILAAVTRLVA